MATIITNECINCGACEPECPNTAIYAGGVEWELNGVKHPPIATDIFYIVRDKCTECVGFFDHEACAAACPVDCCIPDPDNPEGEDVLIVRAKQLHPDETFAGDVPSRFRKAGTTAPAPPKEAAQPAPAAAAPVPAVAATPTAAADAAAAAAPAVKPAPPRAPGTQPASPKPAVEPKPAALKAAGEMKPAAPGPVVAPKATATPAAAPPPASAPSPAVATVPAEAAPNVPDLQELEVPMECFRCGRTSAVPFKHFRAGAVLYCPSCHGSYVVSTSMHNGVSRSLRDFHKRLCEQLDRLQAQRKKELEEFEQRQRAQLAAFKESLKEVSREFRPPGAPRQRGRLFG